MLNQSQIMRTKICCVHFHHDGPFGWFEFRKIILCIPMLMLQNDYIQNFGPYKYGNNLNLIVHDSINVGNLMIRIDLWVNMRWATQPYLMIINRSQIMQRKICYVLFRHDKPIGWFEFKKIKLFSPMLMFHNNFIQNCGPHNHRNKLNLIRHDSIIVGNQMIGIDALVNMRWASQPYLMIMHIKLC